ncbi:MAG TPA: RNA methyltransferase [Chitinophagales bacterium]|nr:RNA methyltransferase [Chitinophagales bacterium]
MEKISSLQNPKIKNLKRLEKSSERREQNLILIEGLRETVLALRAGYTIETIFICEEILTSSKEYPLSELNGVKDRYSIAKPVYDSLAYRETTEGVIALARPREHTLDKLQLKANPLILVIEGVEKPGNLGAMLRTCDAAGVDAVIVCDPKTDVYNPNVIRSAVGTVFTSQIAVCETNEAIGFFKKNNITTYAAELRATDTYFQKNFKTATAFVVGTEATGLSTEWINAADEKIIIPMQGKIDSLNVSVSAAVLLFEAVRQRTLPKGGA